LAKLTTKIAHIVTGDLVSKGFAFLATIYLTRTLGTEGFGLVTIAIAYLGYGVFFADFGLSKIGSREVAKSPENRNFTPTEILTARFFMAILVFLISWVSLPFIIKESIQLELTRGFFFTLLVHAILIEWYFNGSQKYVINALSKSIQMGIYLIGVIVFVNEISDVLILPIIYLTGFVCSAMLLLIIVWKYHPFDLRIRSFSVFGKLLKTSTTIGSGLLLSQIISLLPPILIGYFISTSAAGLYGAAFRLILVGMLIDRLFVQLLIPNLAKQWSENQERASINMEHSSRVMLSIGAIISIFIATGASDFTVWLFGDNFLEATSIIVMLSLFLFFTFQNSMFSHGLVAIGKDVQFFKATSYGGLISFILIVVASIHFNTTIVGLSVATGEFVIATLCFYWFRKSISFPYILPFLTTLIIGLIVYWGISYVEIYPYLKAVLSSIMIVVGLFVFRIMRRSDIRWLKSILLK